ncbi:hypothetical protein [Azospirillum argentinense]|uniref:hypothetical protein n=1 Tax=Azospirillum argentinense TaxID=2970906 RepID=UPI0010C148EE|nr:hypothetical protein [Azospirillum argentinense]
MRHDLALAVYALATIAVCGPAAAVPPTINGGDNRLIIPACGYGELLYWRGNDGWKCDGTEIASVWKGYTDTLDEIETAKNAITIPALPNAQGQVPSLWVAPSPPPPLRSVQQPREARRRRKPRPETASLPTRG